MIRAEVTDEVRDRIRHAQLCNQLSNPLTIYDYEAGLAEAESRATGDQREIIRSIRLGFETFGNLIHGEPEDDE